MSQFSASYSSLEEVWGESSIAPKKNKKIPKKSVSFKDPVCQLYETGSASSAYTENDLLEYVNSTTSGPETYSRANFAKSQPITRDVYNQYVSINSQSQSDSEEPQAPASLQEEPSSPPPPPPSKPILKSQQEDDDHSDIIDFMGYMDKNASNLSNSVNKVIPYADIALYILSGIILIFMMEQFVKVGMALRG